MAVESAADLAGFFDDGEFAEGAVYSPPGPGGVDTACTVIVDRGQGRARFDAGRSDAVASERALWVRAAEVVEVARGGSFAMLDGAGVATGESFTVFGLPRLDQTGKVWAVDLVIED